MAVLILAVVPLLLLLLLASLWDRAGYPGYRAAGQGGGGPELVLTEVVPGPLSAGGSVQGVLVVQLVERRVSLIRADPWNSRRRPHRRRALPREQPLMPLMGLRCPRYQK